MSFSDNTQVNLRQDEQEHIYINYDLDFLDYNEILSPSPVVLNSIGHGTFLETIYEDDLIITNQFIPHENTYYTTRYTTNNNLSDSEYESSFDEVECPVLFRNLNKKTKLEISKKEFDCSICQETEKNEIIVRTLECGHKFHQECIDTWFLLKHACHVCRYEI